jgi:hypothetical protein
MLRLRTQAGAGSAGPVQLSGPRVVLRNMFSPVGTPGGALLCPIPIQSWSHVQSSCPLYVTPGAPLKFMLTLK